MGSIIVLILVLGWDSVQQPILSMMNGMDFFLRMLMQELKTGVQEEEARGGSGTTTAMTMVWETVMVWMTY